MCHISLHILSKLSCDSAKGKPVFVEGRLELSTWEKDDQVHSKLQVHAQKVLFLSPPDTPDPIDDLSETAKKTAPKAA